MENLKVFVFNFLAMFLLLVLNVNGQLPEPNPKQRPLCVSQLALVNYACGSLLPGPSPTTTSLPSAASTVVFPEDDGNNHGHRRGHAHRHGHTHGHEQNHGHGHGGTPEDNCCRWLNDVDDECVCELLVRLPPFLSKPYHEYTIKIDDSCTVSYNCGFK